MSIESINTILSTIARNYNPTNYYITIGIGSTLIILVFIYKWIVVSSTVRKLKEKKKIKKEFVESLDAQIEMVEEELQNLLYDINNFGTYHTHNANRALKLIKEVAEICEKIEDLGDLEEIRERALQFANTTNEVVVKIKILENEEYEQKRKLSQYIITANRVFEQVKENSGEDVAHELQKQVLEEISVKKKSVEELIDHNERARNKIHESILDNHEKLSELTTRMRNYRQRYIDSKKFYWKYIAQI